MVTQFYIIEIQQDKNGDYGHIVHYAFDEDPTKARLKAEAKYHEILASAAISETLKHSAIIISDESFPVLNQCYKHEFDEPELVESESQGDESDFDESETENEEQ